MRQAPQESATKFAIGTKKRGNDGNMWIIVKTKTTKRWSKNNNVKTKTKTKTSKMSSKNKNKNKKTKSKRLLADPDTVWGKNKPLEHFWRELSTGKKIVVIYKTKPYKIEALPNGPSAYKKVIAEYEQDPEIEALLTSNMSVDSYEVYLYPRAKDKTVDDVIKNYKKYFRSKMSDGKMLGP